MTIQTKLPPVRVTTDGVYLHIVTDPDYLAKSQLIAERSTRKAPMLPHQEGETVGNIVRDANAIGFSKEAIELIQSSLVIGCAAKMAIVSAYQTLGKAAFSWIGTPTMILHAPNLTITDGTLAFDFSQFQQIPNQVPDYSAWLWVLGAESRLKHREGNPPSSDL